MDQWARRIGAPAAIFLGAGLLFAIEPIAGKLILPRFGGSAAVWTGCLLFFQSALVVGYLYADLLARFTQRRVQAAIHTGLLAISLAFAPFAMTGASALDSEPLLAILVRLAAGIGLPFVLLSATGPLTQSWLASAQGGGSPFRLFALSNLGSMLGLLSYPTLVEPALRVGDQVLGWRIGYAIYAALAIALAWTIGGRRAAPEVSPAPAPTVGVRALWLLLSAAASALLLAVTNHVTQDVVPVPLLWVIPLAIYLTSFILVFGWPGLYRRIVWLPLGALGMAALAYGAVVFPISDKLGLVLALHGAGFFVVCVVLNGELEALKPDPARLTGYYLTIAVGGAVGAVLVAAIAPIVLVGPFDLPILLVATGFVVASALWRRYPPLALRSWRAVFYAVGASAMLGMTAFMAMGESDQDVGAVRMARNFYGSLMVADVIGDQHVETLQLSSGNIVHGDEIIEPPGRRLWATTYYAPSSGVGLAIAALRGGGPLSVGVIGLGAGTLAAYARPGDAYRFYEINPLDMAIARSNFDFLGRCADACRIVEGDARLSLEREGDAGPKFDVLVVDAFSGDAIPAHLLTHEAFALYARRLKPAGVIAVHVSNRYLDLAPLVAAEGRAVRMQTRELDDEDDAATDTYQSNWALVTARPDLFRLPLMGAAQAIPPRPGVRLWTDDYSSLWPLLR